MAGPSYKEGFAEGLRAAQEERDDRLAKACEVIAALLGIPDMECPHCEFDTETCEAHAEACAFLLERIKERRG